MQINKLHEPWLNFVAHDTGELYILIVTLRQLCPKHFLHPLGRINVKWNRQPEIQEEEHEIEVNDRNYPSALFIGA